MLVLFIALHFNRTMAKENPLLLWPLRYLDYQQTLSGAASLQKRIGASMAPPSAWKVQYAGEAADEDADARHPAGSRSVEQSA